MRISAEEKCDFFTPSSTSEAVYEFYYKLGKNAIVKYGNSSCPLVQLHMQDLIVIVDSSESRIRAYFSIKNLEFRNQEDIVFEKWGVNPQTNFRHIEHHT